jgi:hypothetical protein
VEPSIPPVVFVQNGSEIFSVSASNLSGYRGFARSEGSVGFTIERLVFAGSADRGDFVLADDFLVLGSEERMQTLTGRRVGDARRVEEVLAFRASRTTTELVASVRVGSDTVVLRAPLEGAEPVLLEVNGTAFRVDPQRFEDLAGIPGAPATSFEDAGRCRREMQALSLMAAELYPPAPLNPLAAPDSCAFPCVVCGASVLGYAVSFVALASCATVVGCIPAVGAHVAAGASVLSNCGQCGVCNDDPPPIVDDGGQDDPPDSGGECPQGYHECPGNNCCPDDDGGSCCPCVPVCVCGIC